MAKRTATADKKPQTKISQFFDDDLMPRIRAGADKAGLSMSGYVQELVRDRLPKAKKTKAKKKTV